MPGNATFVTFQALNPTPTSQLTLYARAGLPVPGPFNYDYTSATTSTGSDQFIVITTNSTPLPLPTATTNSAAPIFPTTWYLAVYNNSPGSTANYSILATVATNGPSGAPGALDVMQLKSGFVKTGVAQPGFTTNIIYALNVQNNPAGVQFTLANQSLFGGLELLAGLNEVPTPGNAFDANYSANVSPVNIEVGKSAAMPSVNGVWYLAVANTAITPINYTITGTIIPSGTVTTTPFIVDDQLTTSQPLFLGSRIASPSSGFSLYWAAAPGQTYNIEVSTDLVNWSLVTSITSPNPTLPPSPIRYR